MKIVHKIKKILKKITGVITYNYVINGYFIPKNKIFVSKRFGYFQVFKFSKPKKAILCNTCHSIKNLYYCSFFLKDLYLYFEYPPSKINNKFLEEENIYNFICNSCVIKQFKRIKNESKKT